MDNKRLLIAFLLSFAFIWGYRYFLLPPAPPADPAAPPAVAEVQPVAPAPAVTPQVVPGGTDSAAIVAEAPEDVRIETDLYTALFTNTGGVLKSFRLKNYLDSEERPLELINAIVANTVGWPLGLVSGDSALDKEMASALYRVQRAGQTLTFEYASGGVEVRKTFVFEERPYLIRATTSLTRGGAAVPHDIVLQGGFGDQGIQPPNPAYQQALYGDSMSGYTRTLLSSIEEPQPVTAPIIGVEDQYFLGALIRETPGPAKISKSDYRLPDGTDARALYVSTPATEPVLAYFGPKQSAALAAADPRLSEVPDYGWFGFFTKPLISLLSMIHGLVGNYGWAIVLLTLVINIAMFPLRVKQQVSMHKMQKLAPQMRALQDKYKKMKAGDPKRAEIEAEIMKMNKEQMAGCLPALLQMPLLFAFWSMLSVSIELRHAPWMLWIHDLSRHDPYYILPILMGISMFVQQRMMPSTMEPAQARMMMLMPLIFLGFFLWAQSGVVVYWLTSNVIGIIQQWVIMKYWHPEAAARPARQRSKMA
jgi:YidC/Oxa1 family membrane protein insertase